MSRITDKINELRTRKQRLEEAQRITHDNRLNKDVKQFYYDSSVLSNYGKGIAIIITPTEEYREFTDLSFDDKKAARIVLHRATGDKIDFDSSNKDYRDVVTQDYNTVLISMSSVLSKPTEVYVPQNPSDYQIAQIKEFNKQVKEFNDENFNRVRLHYDGLGDSVVYNLDALIETIDPEYGNSAVQK